MPRRPLPPWWPLATETLTATILQRHDRATRAAQQLHDQFGSEVIPRVLKAWIDTLLARYPKPAAAVGPRFLGEETGALGTVDTVPPSVAWAGRLIAARANDDRLQFVALINSVESDEQWSANVKSVLNVVSTTLRMLGVADELRKAGHS